METERKLIGDYQTAVQTVVAALRAGFGCNDLLSARRRGKIPKDGMISGVEFSFHGVGCRGIVDGIEVDFDFGPDERTDGFDAWRLWGFAKQKPAIYPQFRQLEDVESALGMLGREGEIECPRTAPSPHLWYLRPC